MPLHELIPAEHMGDVSCKCWWVRPRGLSIYPLASSQVRLATLQEGTKKPALGRILIECFRGQAQRGAQVYFIFSVLWTLVSCSKMSLF